LLEESNGLVKKKNTNASSNLKTQNADKNETSGLEIKINQYIDEDQISKKENIIIF
jgi:hypothetical protein